MATIIRKTVRRNRNPGEMAKPMSRAIRLQCLACCGHNAAEVVRCTGTDCWLWPYRLGSGSRAVAQADSEVRPGENHG